MEQVDWKIHFSWVKVHDGIQENELADWLAKEVGTKKDITLCCNKG
jgi:ribonuclease HI